jgi:hypothetical protein
MRLLKRVLAGVALLALLAFPFVIYFNAQALTDWAQLRGYTPPTAVTRLAAADSMTSYASHIFYVNHPDIQSNVGQFRSDCGQTEKTIILGCYHSNQDGIFVFDVKDQRLNGVEEVTAAHEMLHAGYDRLSSQERSKVNAMLQNYFNNQLSDQRIKDTINAYRESEPKDLTNEMHSIFGTEVSNLPAPLENYYKRYYNDRQTVTSFAQAYQEEFTTREDQIKAYDSQLKNMKIEIDQQEQDLKSQLVKIETDRAKLDNLKSSGRIDEYNSGVASFNNEINTYNSGIARLRADINSYNSLVEAYNSTASELASLQQAIDTRLTNQAAQ